MFASGDNYEAVALCATMDSHSRHSCRCNAQILGNAALCGGIYRCKK